MINEDYIKNAKDYLKSDIYDLGLQGPTHVINNDKTKDKSIIFVTDSYGFIVQPYLAMQVKRIDVTRKIRRTEPRIRNAETNTAEMVSNVYPLKRKAPRTARSVFSCLSKAGGFPAM